MKKSIFILAFVVIFVAALHIASASVAYDYNTRYGAHMYVGTGKPSYYGYSAYDRDYQVYNWDDNDLRWEKDPVNAWIQDGDGWREETFRARTVDEVIGSYENRYALSYGRSSGDVHYYDRYTPDLDEAKPSNWRFKEAYTPEAYGRDAYYGNGYYYEPRYDYDSETFNWRY